MFYATIKRFDEKENTKLYFSTEKSLKEYLNLAKKMNMFYEVVEYGEMKKISINY